MKQVKSLLLPAAGMGALGLVLGRLLYALALDDKGLLVRYHPLSIVLCLLIPVSLVWVILSCCKKGRSIRSSSGPWAPVGKVLTAGILIFSVLTADISSQGTPGRLWQILGLLSAGGLIWRAGCALLGKRDSFVSDLMLCLFLLSHLVSNYRQWCADPQILDYLFELLGMGAWMLFAYYCACARVGLGKPRMHLATGLLTVIFCLSALGARGNWLLCLGGAFFAASSLAFPTLEEDVP